MWDDLRRNARRLQGARSETCSWSLREVLLSDDGFRAPLFHRAAHRFQRRRIHFRPPAQGFCMGRTVRSVTSAVLGNLTQASTRSAMSSGWIRRSGS